MGRYSKLYLGIDPGKQGGMGILRSDGVVVTTTRMPTGKVRIMDWISTALAQAGNLVMALSRANRCRSKESYQPSTTAGILPFSKIQQSY